MTATTDGDTRHLIQRFLDAHARGDAEAISRDVRNIVIDGDLAVAP
jgi:hypothetical protein